MMSIEQLQVLHPGLTVRPIIGRDEAWKQAQEVKHSTEWAGVPEQDITEALVSQGRSHHEEDVAALHAAERKVQHKLVAERGGGWRAPDEVAAERFNEAAAVLRQRRQATRKQELAEEAEALRLRQEELQRQEQAAEEAKAKRLVQQELDRQAALIEAKAAVKRDEQPPGAWGRLAARLGLLRQAA